MGVDGEGSVEIGKTGAIIPTGEQEEIDAVPGTTVRTTISPDLQAIAQESIDEVVTAQGADWGCVVVMEPATGKLLVLADSTRSTRPTSRPLPRRIAPPAAFRRSSSPAASARS